MAVVDQPGAIMVALIAVTGAMLLVRIGWRRSRAVAAAGWVAAITGLTALTTRDGAWGLAIGTTVAIAAALAIVLYAGWTSPARSRRPARQAAAITIPRQGYDLTRRLAVFALVVPGAFAAAQWLAFGAQALARRGGIGNTDTIVLTLFLQPILWSLIMAMQMTRANATRMIAPPVAAAVLGTILWSAA